MNKKLIREVRESWQFFRDRRPETYQELARLQRAPASAVAPAP